MEVLCRVLQVAKSSYYNYLRQQKQKAQGHQRKRPGPKVQIDDQGLLVVITAVLHNCPFDTEGIRKVQARLRRQGIVASRKRINRLMREHGLLSPQRYQAEEPKTHDGTIIPTTINQIWGTDATLFGTTGGDLLWLFAVIDHFSGKILG